MYVSESIEQIPRFEASPLFRLPPRCFKLPRIDARDSRANYPRMTRSPSSRVPNQKRNFIGLFVAGRSTVYLASQGIASRERPAT